MLRARSANSVSTLPCADMRVESTARTTPVLQASCVGCLQILQLMQPTAYSQTASRWHRGDHGGLTGVRGRMAGRRFEVKLMPSGVQCHYCGGAHTSTNISARCAKVSVWAARLAGTYAIRWTHAHLRPAASTCGQAGRPWAQDQSDSAKRRL